ncbi:hypothetical protein Desti_2196 [Desulfomonile tiedjei DSM 6799]|uniref:Uncharacterized protein n=1 Tax=Desulfomonile tiedjei (strain ATCC 49306 / DSM 6799 / DCB-1) TaxID=706587 RepID=I4C5P9_DESTA|nr:hypothetical protein Desti_2196 [Desulfomonile tiedjei DSM 6799]
MIDWSHCHDMTGEGHVYVKHFNDLVHFGGIDDDEFEWCETE